MQPRSGLRSPLADARHAAVGYDRAALGSLTGPLMRPRLRDATVPSASPDLTTILSAHLTGRQMARVAGGRCSFYEVATSINSAPISRPIFNPR